MSPINFPTGKIGLKKNNVNIIVSKKFGQFSVNYVSVKSKLKHPPPGIPRAFDVFSCPGGREFDKLSLPVGGAFDHYSGRGWGI